MISSTDIVSLLCREFGFIDDDLQPLHIDELKKVISARTFYDKALKAADKIRSESMMTTIDDLKVQKEVINAMAEYNKQYMNNPDIESISVNATNKIKEIVNG